MENIVIIKGLDRVEAAFRKTPAMVRRRMTMAAGDSAEIVAAEARAIHRFKSKSSDLHDAIFSHVDPNNPTVGVAGIRDKDVMVPWRGHGMASYGVFQHEGTRSHWVMPYRRKALAWEVAPGKMRFSKGHFVSGIRPDQFVYIAAARKARAIQAIYDKQVNAAIKEAGL